MSCPPERADNRRTKDVLMPAHNRRDRYDVIDFCCVFQPKDKTDTKNCKQVKWTSDHNHCHRNIFNATTKLTRHHAASIAIGTRFDDSDAPSFISARSPLLSAVSGKAWMNGCRICGNRSDEKNVPDSNHIGNMMKFIKPDTPSIVVGRAATSNPIPENVKPPSIVINATLSHEPRTVKPNTSHANTITAATSSTRNTKRESMNESR